MKEEDALSKPPEGRGTKLSGRCLTLSDAVSEPVPHVVERKIREEVNVLSTDRAEIGLGKSGKDEWYPNKGAVKVPFSFGLDHSSMIHDEWVAQRARS